MSQGADTDIAVLYADADALRRERRIDAAMEAFLSVARRAEQDGESEWLDKAYAQALNCAVRLKLWELTETVARRAIVLRPNLATAHARLGEALIAAERRDEAVVSLQQALALDPADEDARVLLHLARRPPASAQAVRKTRAWPVRQAAFDDPADLVRRYLLRGHPTEFAIARETSFTTIGSCFAHSLGKRLKGAGYAVRNEEIGEEVNSPLANRAMFDWIEHGPRSEVGQTMEALFGAEVRGRMREAISASDVVVLTLGVAPCFFEAASGQFVFLPNGSSTARDYLQNHCVMRTTTVAENVAAIDDILAAIGRISQRGAQVVLTVSPVPLSGSNEFESAIVADCLSKSTLRLACHEAITARAGRSSNLGGVAYWPSFEIVRWLGAHFSRETAAPFGADDGNTRHVSRWLVKMIVGLFLEHYSADRPSAEAGEAAA